MAILFRLSCLAACLGLAFSIEPLVEPKLLTTLKKSATANIIVSFKETRNKEIISAYEKEKSLLQRSLDYDSLPQRLMAHADETQAKVINLLSGMKKAKSGALDFTKLWIVNKLFVKNADVSVIDALKQMGEISYIEEDPVYDMSSFLGDTSPRESVDGKQNGEIAWGVQDIGAPEAWANNITGRGIVVGILDTGVNAEHEALKDNWRKEFGWFDAANGVGLRPYDDNGHGTHCAGTAVGRNGIGVAPDAQWIACKGLNGLFAATGSSIFICGMWMLCPFDPLSLSVNCSMRPDVVSNSWGFVGLPNQNQLLYTIILEAWRASGMVVLFANGNSGQLQCNSANFPGEYVRVMGVGATDRSNRVTDFSSRGPSRLMTIKPDISAPGRDIRSAGHRRNDAYVELSGTSMATPHVAGLAALMLSKNRTLGHDGVRAGLIAGAQPVVPPRLALPCGGRSASQIPNNYVGYGKVNAPASLGLRPQNKGTVVKTKGHLPNLDLTL